MNNYKLTLCAPTTSIPWEWEFEIASDWMAIKYAKKMLSMDKFTGTYNLWNMTNNQSLISIITVLRHIEIKEIDHASS